MPEQEDSLLTTTKNTIGNTVGKVPAPIVEGFLRDGRTTCRLFQRVIFKIEKHVNDPSEELHALFDGWG